MRKIWIRLTNDSPSFFKKIQAIAITVGSIGGTILGAPLVVPGFVVPAALATVAAHMITIGIIGTALGKLTLADPSVLENPNS